MGYENIEGYLWYVDLEKVVEVPQANAAPNAKSAAVTVPAPVSKLTIPPGNVTKYAAATANNQARPSPAAPCF